jgi:hypothetical protein
MSGGEPGDQLRGEGLLAGGHPAERGVDDGVGAALAHGDEANLRKRAGGFVVAGAAELLLIGRGISYVEHETVDGHHR